MQLILAPMQGLTELLFRRVFHLAYPQAFDYAVSPFLSLTHGDVRRIDRKMEDVLPEFNKDCLPVVPQLLGHEAEEFVSMANQLYEMGYTEVNWNMGCPMRRVAGKHRGSGILPYPGEVKSILAFVIPRIKPKLSVKVRLGYYSPCEIDSIIPILNDFPLSNITVHPRIGKQMYSGQPDIEKFAQILPLIYHPVIYNGDICTPYDYQLIRRRFPQLQGVMIGRGALYNPLLPSVIRCQFPDDFSAIVPSSLSELPSLETFVLMLTEAIVNAPLSSQAKVRKIKEYWCLLSRNLKGTELSKRRLLHAEDLDDILRLIHEMAK